MALTKEEKEKLRLQAEVNARRGLLYDNAIRSLDPRSTVREGEFSFNFMKTLNPLNEGFLGPNSSGVNTVNMNVENLPIVGNTETLIADELPGRELVDQNNARSQALLNELPSNLTPEEITARLNLNSGQTKEYDPSQTYRMQGLFEGGDANVAPIQQRAMAPSIVSRSIEAEEEKYGPGGKFSATPLPGGIYDRSGTGVTNFSMSQNPVFTRVNESTNISPTNIFSVDNERKKIDQRARLLRGITAVFGGNPRAADIYRKNRSAVIDQLAARQAILGGPEDGYSNKGAAFRYLVAQGLPINDATKYAEFLVDKPIDPSTRKKDRTQLTQSIRKEYIAESKEYKSKVNSFRTSLSAAKQKTGPGDVALVFNFMKTLDPTSTVREGEFATASQAGGIEQTFLNAYNKAREGVLLTDKVRNLLMDTIKDDFRQAHASQNIIKNNYREIARDAELNENLVVTELVPIVEKDGDSFFKIGTILVPIVDQLNEIERQELKLLRRQEALSLIDKDSRYKENNQGN